jgi:hypothetical protein
VTPKCRISISPKGNKVNSFIFDNCRDSFMLYSFITLFLYFFQSFFLEDSPFLMWNLKKKSLHQLLPIPCLSHVSSSLHEDSASLWMLTVVIMKHLHPNKILIPISVLPSQPSPIQRSSNRVCPSDSWKLQFLKDVFFRRFFVNEESSILEIVSLRLSLRIVSQVTSWLFVNFQVSLINYQCFW